MYKAKVNQSEFDIVLNGNNEGSINGESFKLDLIKTGNNRFHIIRNNKSYTAELVSFDEDEKSYKIKVNGNVYTVGLKDKFDLLLQSMGMDALAAKKVNDLKAPMPGLVLDIRVKVGDIVKKGDPLVVLEAMKMENILKASNDVVIKKVAVEKGNAVEKNQLLLLFEA
jgi:acetyl/propionyl-CoA carboxylase alpha subunit